MRADPPGEQNRVGMGIGAGRAGSARGAHVRIAVVVGADQCAVRARRARTRSTSRSTRSGIWQGSASLGAVYWTTFRTRVPLYLSSNEACERVAALLPADRAFSFLDIGCGVGTVLAESGAALSGRASFAVSRSRRCPSRCPGCARRRLGVSPRNASISGAQTSRQYDVVYAFLSPVPMSELWRKARAEMRPGSLLVSNTFRVDGVPGRQRDTDRRRPACAARLAHVRRAPRMDMMELVRAWSGREVPVLASTLAALKVLRRNEDRITGRDVSRVVLHDPLLTLRVLRYAQAKQTSRQPTEITTVEHAVMMYGITSFFREFSAVPALETVLADDPVALQGALGVISRAHHAAAYARAIAAHRHDIESDEVTIGALLHDLAELLLWCHLAARRRSRSASWWNDARGLRSAAAQTVVLGFSNVDLQLALAETWNLPELLRRLMDDHHAAQPRVVNVVTAVALARHSANGWSDPALPDDFRRLEKMFGLSEEQSWRLVRNASLQAARNWTDHGVRPSAAWLPLEAGHCELPQSGTHGPSPQTRKRSSGHCSSSRRRRRRRTRPALAALALQGIHRGLGLQHVVFAEVDPVEEAPAGALQLRGCDRPVGGGLRFRTRRPASASGTSCRRCRASGQAETTARNWRPSCRRPSDLE